MILNVLFASGFFILVFATFCIDHFHLHGLSQAFNFDISAALRLSVPSKSHGAAQLRVFVPWLAHNPLPRSHLHARRLLSCCTPHHDGFLAWYHPPQACLILLCSLLSHTAFWATPVMNGSRLLMAAFNSIYLVSAVKFLEGTFAVALLARLVLFQSRPALCRAAPQKSTRPGVLQVFLCCSSYRKLDF
jgi:hypothetical protein